VTAAIYGDRFGRRRLDQEQDWVRREIRIALQKPGCRVIPVLIDGAELPDEREALPEDISALVTRQRFYLRQACRHVDIEALSKEIEKAGFPRLATLTTSPVRVLPHLAYGTWTLRNAIDEQEIDWSNSTLKFTDQEETPDGLLFRGTFTWRRRNVLVGAEEFTGHYVAATRQLIFDGTAVSDRTLAVGSYSAVLSPDGRTIVEGRWGSSQLKDDPASPGLWEAFR